MNPDRLEALIWARIDGVIGPMDLAELEAHLAEHPEQSELERQIASIARGLAEMDRVESPAALRVRIKGALASAVAPGPDVQVAAPQPVLSRRQWPNRWLPMAASLLIGTVVGYLLHPGADAGLDVSKVGGTMATPPALEARSDIQINLDRDQGSLTIGRSDALVTADFSIISSSGLWLVMKSDSGELELDDASHIGNAVSRLQCDGSRFDFQSDGPGRYTLTIRATDRNAAILISVGSGSEVLSERRIEPNTGGGNP